MRLNRLNKGIVFKSESKFRTELHSQNEHQDEHVRLGIA